MVRIEGTATGTSRPVTPAPRAVHRGLLVGVSALVGVAIAILWSARLVDDDIGVNTASGLIGTNATDATVTGTATGLIFAFVTGVAGTFTACNVAVFSAIAPMVHSNPSVASRIRMAFAPLGWLALGAVAVAGTYGAVGALLGSRIPQLSPAVVGGHIPVRTLQSIVVFGVIGLVMLYMGLASAELVPDPLRRPATRWAPTRPLFMGLLIGGFLIGRPWPLFRKMFAYAASTHDAAFGAAVFMLIVLGNMILLGVIFLALSASRFPRWLRANPSRAVTVATIALVVGGVFTFVYWDVRVPAGLGFGWFPSMPWH
ncbi:MAG TPA: hypothetical protein VFX16_10360 [Pseudonocardiaceae bacterium]|nr:hypothetical protein [Pseudonocardiaceae bacterium]